MTNERGVCPICNGTGHMPCPDNMRKYGLSNGWYGYRIDDDTVTCRNCGGQTMYGKPSGTVLLNKAGVPCVHEYSSYSKGRCYTGYVCIHCGDSYDIDSGD